MLITIVLTTLFVIPYASSFEWTLHRFFMHRPIGRFDYAYKAHALVHHRIFRADYTYHHGRFDYRRLLWGIRIPALVYASSEKEEHRAYRTLFPIEWSSLASPPVHEPELQCGASTRRPILWDTTFAFRGAFQTGDGSDDSNCLPRTAGERAKDTCSSVILEDSHHQGQEILLVLFYVC